MKNMHVYNISVLHIIMSSVSTGIVRIVWIVNFELAEWEKIPNSQYYKYCTYVPIPPN